MPRQFYVQGFYRIGDTFVHMLPYPLLDCFFLLSQLLPTCPVQHTVFAPVTGRVVVRETQKIKAFLCPFVSSKGQDSAFVLCYFKAELLQSLYQKLIEFLCFVLVLEQAYKVSRPEEPPLKSLSEPYVNLSAHTAPIIQPLAVSQISSVRTGSCHALLSLRASVPPFV